ITFRLLLRRSAELADGPAEREQIQRMSQRGASAKGPSLRRQLGRGGPKSRFRLRRSTGSVFANRVWTQAHCATPPVPDFTHLHVARRLLATKPMAVFLALGDESVLGLGASSARKGFVGQIHERLQRTLPGIELAKLAAPNMTAAELL